MVEENPNFVPILSNNDIRASGLRMFANVMLQAWRTRQADYSSLSRINQNLKNDITQTRKKTRNVIDSTKTQKDINYKISLDIKRTLDAIECTDHRFKKLKETADKIKQEKSVLMKDYEVKYKEYKNLYTLLRKTKIEINQVLLGQENLQRAVFLEKIKTEELEKKKSEILCQISNLKSRRHDVEIMLLKEKETLNKSFNHLEYLKSIVYESKGNVSRLQRTVNLDSVLDDELQKLNLELTTIKTKDEKFKVLIKYFGSFVTFNTIYMFVFMVLPRIKISRS